MSEIHPNDKVYALSRAVALAEGRQMTCCDCKRTNPDCGFQRRKDRPKGITSYCRDCLRARWRKWAYGEEKRLEWRAG